MGNSNLWKKTFTLVTKKYIKIIVKTNVLNSELCFLAAVFSRR
jgi:hypothetical protein